MLGQARPAGQGAGPRPDRRYAGLRNFPVAREFIRRDVRSRVEVSALHQAGAAGVHGRSPLLRLQSDERLIALVRRGSHHAFEALVARYQSRLLAFCRHMLSSREDAEDVLQEVFAAAFNAILADERPINVRPWLYRIARNRSLNHLRRTQAVGVDSMDVHLSEGGLTTADKVHKREEFRQLIADVQDLPETQRTALLLREIDALSYEQIAEAMETTVPSVKSLLVRARVSLGEAAEARLLSCEQVRMELGAVAEGLSRTTAPVRRHLRSCERCATFRKHLRRTNKSLAAVYPVAPLLLLKKTLLAHLGTTAAAGGGAAAGSGGAAACGAAATTLATKCAAGLAAAAIVTAGAVEVKHVAQKPSRGATVAAVAPLAPAAPAAATPIPPVTVASVSQPEVERAPRKDAEKADAEKPAAAEHDPEAKPGAEPTPAATEQREGDTTTLQTETTGSAEPTPGSIGPAASQPAPGGEAASGPSEEPAPASGEPQGSADPESGPAPILTGTSPLTPAAEPAPADGEPAPEPDPEPTPDPQPAPAVPVEPAAL
jgi:RNA polymerase sigma factor (sigma-70 family)